MATIGTGGDGTTDSTEAVQQALLDAASQSDRTIYFPSGRYRLTHPVAWPPGICIRGDPISVGSVPGTLFVCDDAFDTKYNNLGIFPGMFQSGRYAPDPSGTNRWQTGEWDHGNRIEDIGFQNLGKAAVHGLCVHNAGENFLIRNVSVKGCALGVSVTGGNATLTIERLLLNNNTSGGIRFHRNPALGSDGIVGPLNGGIVQIRGISGDANGPSMIHVEGGHTISIHGLKYEQALDPSWRVIDFAIDPYVIGKGWGFNGPANKPIVTVVGCTIDPGAMTHAVVIFNAGTLNPVEWTKPTINFIGCRCNARNWLFDHTRNISIGWDSQPIYGAYYGFGSTVFCYSADVDEKWLVSVPYIHEVGATTK